MCSTVNASTHSPSDSRYYKHHTSRLILLPTIVQGVLEREAITPTTRNLTHAVLNISTYLFTHITLNAQYIYNLTNNYLHVIYIYTYTTFI